MVEARETQAWKFYEKHLNFFFEKDIDGLLKNDYNEDAVVVSYDFVVKGHDGLRQLFTQYLEMIGDIKLISTDQFNETDDAIMLEATLETSKAGERKVYDVFVMRDGKISYHFTGVK